MVLRRFAGFSVMEVVGGDRTIGTMMRLWTLDHGPHSANNDLVNRLTQTKRLLIDMF